MSDPVQEEVENWWHTRIIEMSPGTIRYRGYPVEELIGNVSFPQMIWLLVMGKLPNAAQSKLLEAALTAAVDHGPQAPSIGLARMAVTCGVGLNNAIASAVNTLGDVHGGAGEQAVEFYQNVVEAMDSGMSVEEAVERKLSEFFDREKGFVPGFGHRFHPVDPRAPRLLELVDQATQAGDVSGIYATIARQIEWALKQKKGKRIPMNIDGATAVIYAELGCPPPLARGFFCLSRSVGILAHAWEQTQQEERNKGPLPKKFLWKYEGEPRRKL